jgi:hypothetical protein
MMRDFLLDNLPGCDMLGMSLSVGVPETSSRDTGPHLEEFVSANDSPKQFVYEPMGRATVASRHCLGEFCPCPKNNGPRIWVRLWDGQGFLIRATGQMFWRKTHTSRSTGSKRVPIRLKGQESRSRATPPKSPEDCGVSGA